MTKISNCNETDCVLKSVCVCFVFRDPNSVQTLSAFHKGIDWAKSGQFTQQDIDEAKLSVFSAVDSPVAPANKGEALDDVILSAAAWSLNFHVSTRLFLHLYSLGFVSTSPLPLYCSNIFLDLIVNDAVWLINLIGGAALMMRYCFFVLQEWVASSVGSQTKWSRVTEKDCLLLIIKSWWTWLKGKPDFDADAVTTQTEYGFTMEVYACRRSEVKETGNQKCITQMFSCRYLSVGQRTCGVAILGPENDMIKKDPSWILK